MRGLLAALLASFGLAAAARAQPAAEFFHSHPISVYVGYGPGGGYDLDCRLFAQFLGRHVPGNPVVVVQNMPGAGSLRLANELYVGLPKDGTAIGMIGEDLLIAQVLGEPEARFDPVKFNWIGRIADPEPVLALRPDAGIRTFKDALTKTAVIGVPGAGSATMLTLTVIDNLFGAKFTLISGYEGSAQIRLAVERGEVQGTGSSQWRIDKDWMRRLHLRIIYQASLDRDAELPGVPTVAELGRSEDERRLLTFFSSYTVIGRSILAPPGVPEDRLAALRAAFMATVADPAFVAAADKANLELAVMPGDQLTALIAKDLSLPGPLLDEAKRAAGKLASGN
jgi:tripartite-type tricarboxylate transporter receptor subunit TctC